MLSSKIWFWLDRRLAFLRATTYRHDYPTYFGTRAIRPARLVMHFKIGEAFAMSGRGWVCTDVGTRTICAVRADDLVESGDSGPPYSIEELVLDAYSMDACEPLPTCAARPKS